MVTAAASVTEGGGEPRGRVPALVRGRSALRASSSPPNPASPSHPPPVWQGGQRGFSVGATVGQLPRTPEQRPQLGASVNVPSIIHSPVSNALPSPLLCCKTPWLSHPAITLSPRVRSITFSAWVTVFRPGNGSAHAAHRTDARKTPSWAGTSLPFQRSPTRAPNFLAHCWL